MSDYTPQKLSYEIDTADALRDRANLIEQFLGEFVDSLRADVSVCQVGEYVIVDDSADLWIVPEEAYGRAVRDIVDEIAAGKHEPDDDEGVYLYQLLCNATSNACLFSSHGCYADQDWYAGLDSELRVAIAEEAGELFTVTFRDNLLSSLDRLRGKEGAHYDLGQLLAEMGFEVRMDSEDNERSEIVLPSGWTLDDDDLVVGEILGDAAARIV